MLRSTASPTALHKSYVKTRLKKDKLSKPYNNIQQKKTAPLPEAVLSIISQPVLPDHKYFLIPEIGINNK